MKELMVKFFFWKTGDSQAQGQFVLSYIIRSCDYTCELLSKRLAVILIKRHYLYRFSYE